MDAIATLHFFDRWFAHHKATCGVQRLDMTCERHGDATRITLSCPTCGNTLSGFMNDADMPQIIQRLKPERARFSES